MVIKNLVQIIIAIKKIRVLKLNVPQYHNEYRYELIKHQKLNFLLFLSSSHHSHKKKYFLSFIWRVMKRWDFILLPLFFPLPPTHTLPRGPKLYLMKALRTQSCIPEEAELLLLMPSFSLTLVLKLPELPLLRPPPESFVFRAFTWLPAQFIAIQYYTPRKFNSVCGVWAALFLVSVAMSRNNFGACQPF